MSISRFEFRDGDRGAYYIFIMPVAILGAMICVMFV